MKDKYNEFSYPGFLAFDFVYFFWRKICCKRGWHLWDEVLSRDGEGSHYLHCDACGQTVYIKDHA